MQHNDLDALIRQISQQCGDPAAAARLKARMQNPVWLIIARCGGRWNKNKSQHIR